MGVMRIKIYTGRGASLITLFDLVWWFVDSLQIDKLIAGRFFVVKISLSYLKKDEKETGD